MEPLQSGTHVYHTQRKEDAWYLKIERKKIRYSDGCEKVHVSVRIEFLRWKLLFLSAIEPGLAFLDFKFPLSFRNNYQETLHPLHYSRECQLVSYMYNRTVVPDTFLHTHTHLLTQSFYGCWFYWFWLT